jgi:hypothetical protein
MKKMLRRRCREEQDKEDEEKNTEGDADPGSVNCEVYEDSKVKVLAQ